MASPAKDELPSGAITVLNKMISQQLLDWREPEFDFFTTEKGTRCEDQSIDLYNEVHDEFYVKNIERVTIGNLTGECDLLDKVKSLVIDIKTAYSKATYPLVLKLSTLYEWQLRAYMYLYNVDHAELAYCLVSTPPDLVSNRDPLDWHEVDDVSEKLRVSTLRIERCPVKESQMLKRLDLCERYILDFLDSKKD